MWVVAVEEAISQVAEGSKTEEDDVQLVADEDPPGCVFASSEIRQVDQANSKSHNHLRVHAQDATALGVHSAQHVSLKPQILTDGIHDHETVPAMEKHIIGYSQTLFEIELLLDKFL